MYDKHQLYAMAANQKKTSTGKKIIKIQNKAIFIYHKENELIENILYLQTKTSISIKIRDKKKFTKNLSEANIPGGIFPGTLQENMFYPLQRYVIFVKTIRGFCREFPFNEKMCTKIAPYKTKNCSFPLILINDFIIWEIETDLFPNTLIVLFSTVCQCYLRIFQKLTYKYMATL